MNYLQEAFGVGKNRGCRVVQLHRSVYYYQSTRPSYEALSMRIDEIASTRVRYGYYRIYILLRREGWRVNHKKVYRIYKEKGLEIRHKRPKRCVSAAHRNLVPVSTENDECWSMDFVHAQLFNGRKIRCLTVVDTFSRTCPMIKVDYRLSGEDVVAVMDKLRYCYGRVPKRIKVDNGSEFISKALDKWAYENGVTLCFSRPGKPTDNAFIESFNGSLRDECLNTNWFLSLTDAIEKIEAWRQDYNQFRPHSALNYLTPDEFLGQHEGPSQQGNLSISAVS